ncbi:hypothetical protein Esti_004833 [Eimeria stiedai]
MAFNNSLRAPGLGLLTTPSCSFGGFPVTKEEAASPRFSAAVEQPWFLGLQPNMLQGTAVPLSSAAEGSTSDGIPILVQCGPTLLERFYAVHRILDASQRLSSRLELREAPPDSVDKRTRAVVPVIFSLRQPAYLSSAAEEQQASPSRARQTVGSGGTGQALEAPFFVKAKRSKGEVESEPIRRKSHRHGQDEKHRASVVAGSGASAAKAEDATWDIAWYDRELRRNLKKERELIASKVRLIEEAWIERMRLDTSGVDFPMAAGRLSHGCLSALTATAVDNRKKVAPHVKEELKRQEEERAKREFLETLAATKIQAAYLGFCVRRSIALRVPDVQFKLRACSVSKKSSKRQYWWQRVKEVGAVTYWELVLDLKVQALASRLNASRADRQLAAEAAALAKELEEARAAPHKSFDASAYKIFVPSSTAASPGADAHAEGQSPADAAHARSASEEKGADVCELKSSRKLQPSSSAYRSTGPAAFPEVDAKAAKLPEGVCRESLKSGYEAIPADVIAFRASALAVRSLGPHRVRAGLKGERMVKGSARCESLRDTSKQEGAAEQKENLRPFNGPLRGTEQSLTYKDGFTSSALRQPADAFALPEIPEAMGGEHGVDDSETLGDVLETRSAEAAMLRLRAARSRFQRHQQQMAATLKQAGFEGHGQLTPRQQRSEPTLRLRDGAERMQQAGSSAGGRPSWDTGAAPDSLIAGRCPVAGLEKPKDGDAREQRPHATGQKQADEEGPTSLDVDLPVIVVHRHSSDFGAAAATAGDLADASEATAINRQLLLTVCDREMAELEKKLSERRCAAASRRSSPSQQTPRAEVAAEAGVGKAELPSGGVDLEAVREALLKSEKADDEAVGPPQLLTPGVQKVGASENVTSPTDAAGGSIEHLVAEEHAELPLAHVLALQKEMAVEAGARAAAQRAKRLSERRSVASSRVQTPPGEASDEASQKPGLSRSNTVDLEVVGQALLNGKGAEGETSPPAQPQLTGVEEAAPSEDAVGVTEGSKYELAVARERVRSRQKALGLETGEVATVQRAKRLEERRSAAATRRGSVQQTPRKEADGGETTAGAELRSSAVDLEAVGQALLKDKGAESEVGAPPAQPVPPGVRQEAATSEDIRGIPEAAEDCTHHAVPSDHADVASAHLRARQQELLLAVGERAGAQRERRFSGRRFEAATILQTPRGVPADEGSATAEVSDDPVDLAAVGQKLLKDEEAGAELSQRIQLMPLSTSEAKYEGDSDAPDSGSSEQLVADERLNAALAHLRVRQKELAMEVGEHAAARREKRLNERRSEAITRLQTPRGSPAVAGSAEAALSAGSVDPQAVSQALLKDEEARAEAPKEVHAVVLTKDEAEAAKVGGEGAAASAAGCGLSEELASDARGDAALAQLRVRQKDLALTVGELAAAQREKRLSERRSGASTRYHTPRRPVEDEVLGDEQIESGAVDLGAVKEALVSDRGSETQEDLQLQSLPHDEDEAVHEDVRDTGESAEGLSEQGLSNDDLADRARARVVACQKEIFVGVEERAAAQRAKRLTERRSAAFSGLQTFRREPSDEAPAKPEWSPSGLVDFEAVGEALLNDKGAEREMSALAGLKEEAASGSGSRKAVGQGAGDQGGEKLTFQPSSAVAGRQREIPANEEQQGVASSPAHPPVSSGSPDKQLEVRREHRDPERSPSDGDNTFRPRPGPHAVDLSAVSAALLSQRSSPESLEEERDYKTLHRPSQTPVWGRAGGSRPASNEGSLASPGSPIGKHARSALFALEKQRIGPATKALQRVHRVEANEADWVRHQEALVFAMHREAAARVIQHEWRRRRLANLFHAVIEKRRRRERSASQRRRSPSVAAFSDRARDIISRSSQLSSRPQVEESATALGKVRGKEEAQPQFVPIVEDRDDTPTAVVLFHGKREEIESKRRASDSLQTQQASSREPKRSSSDSFPHLSDTRSQGSIRSERLPAIVLRRASRGPVYSSESSRESDWSSSESESEDEGRAADSSHGASIDSHQDDFDMQQRLRRIVREGLDAKMRSTVEGSSVLLPRSRRSQHKDSISSLSANQDLAFGEESSRRGKEDRGLSPEREEHSLIHSGQQGPRGQTQKKRAEQKSHPQRAARSSGTQHQSGFLSPDWQGGNVGREKQRQIVPAELTGAIPSKAPTSGHHGKSPLTLQLGQQQQAQGGKELRSGGVLSGARSAEGERKPGLPSAHKLEGGDASGGEAHALQRPDRKAEKDEGRHICQVEGQCFCCLSAKKAECEDKANLADALPRSPRKPSPREFGGPPALVR